VLLTGSPAPGADGSPPAPVNGWAAADPEATTVLRRDQLPPLSGPPVGAIRADAVTGGATRWSGEPPPDQENFNTGTFSRVLLTGLGGSAEPVQGPPPPLAPGAKDRAIATTRRLAARVAALRGDERTALLAVGAVVGIVLLMLAILLVVVRLAGGSDASPAAPPSPVGSAVAGAAPTGSIAPTTDTAEPTGSPLPPSGGSFTSRHSNLCLAVPQGRTDAGAQLVQRTCGTDFGTGFLLVGKDQPGTYELVSAGTSLCADVLGASMDDGAPVAQWDCNGGANQTFQLRPLADTTGADTGYVQIVAAHSGKCLDVTNASADENAPVQQATCRDPVAEIDPAAGNQSWRFSAS
jgi:Ricin-type beta-trefoil lectin domain-like